MQSKKYSLNSILSDTAIIVSIITLIGVSSVKAGHLEYNNDIVKIERILDKFNFIQPTKFFTNSRIGPNLVDQMKTFKLATTVSDRPNVSWKDAEDHKVNLKTFEGKVVLLNFWASWCQPCIRELPSINRLQTKLGSNKFAVVALNIDRGGKPVAVRFKRKLKLNNLSIYTDKINSVAKMLKIRVLPTTIIFDTKGREVGRMEAAAEWDTEEAILLIQYFINNPNHVDKLGIENARTNSQEFLNLPMKMYQP